ncbi:bifunctional phosphoglucose/phosphomannose isomerase [Candidatus Woesearchaeota archaeon]|nr:bifunctional phosphoglucose/phosphomannose isomerase [Candidatus Woesearchaeota archaeon]
MAGTKDSMAMLGVLDFFHKQCEQAMALGKNIALQPPINAIIVGGVGGSALAGDILSCYLQHRVPFVVNRDYALPAWINKNTAVFIISYSGNTEETLSMYRHARKKECKIIILASGGQLIENAKRDKVPVIEVPMGLNPRDAIGYMAIPFINVLQQSGIVPYSKELPDLVRVLRQDTKAKAKEIAGKLVGKIPMFYSSASMSCVARAWKNKMNENAKIPAFWNELPEMNHNEINGFSHLLGEYFVIFISDQDDDQAIKTRMEATRKLLLGQGVQTLELRQSGDNRLARVFSSLLLGSYVSYFLALEYGIDPSPLPMVEKLKGMIRR